jgi:hypothetical protein
MKKSVFILLVFSFIQISHLSGQVTPKEKGLQSITMDAIKGQLEFLASDWMEGRQTGESGSDYTAFTENKIPVISWMAAMHPDYHQPSDQINLVNWPKMLDIIKLGYLQLWEAANGEIK